MPPPSARWTSLKWICWSSTAPKTLIGTVTAPKAMAPFQMERGGTGVDYPAAHGPQRAPSSKTSAKAVRTAGEPGFEPGFTVLETARIAVNSLPRERLEG